MNRQDEPSTDREEHLNALARAREGEALLYNESSLLTPRFARQLASELTVWTPRRMQRRIDRLEQEVRQHYEQ